MLENPSLTQKNAGHPNTLSKPQSQASPPDQIFNEVIPPIADDDNLFMKWLAYIKASAQNDLSNYALDNKYRTLSNKAWFIFLATLIYFRTVKCI